MPSFKELMSEYTSRLEDIQVDHGTPVSTEARLSIAVIMIFEQLAEEEDPGVTRDEVMDFAINDVVRAATGAEPYGDDGVTVHLSLAMVQALQDARNGEGKYAKDLARRKKMKARIEAKETT